METKYSFPFSQQPATCPYSESDESTLHLSIPSILILCSCLWPGPPIKHFPPNPFMNLLLPRLCHMPILSLSTLFDRLVPSDAVCQSLSPASCTVMSHRPSHPQMSPSTPHKPTPSASVCLNGYQLDNRTLACSCHNSHCDMHTCTVPGQAPDEGNSQGLL